MKNDQLLPLFQNYFKEILGELDLNYDPMKDDIPQGIFYRHEIPIADYLMSYQKALTDEFLAGYSSLEDAINSEGDNTLGNRPEFTADNQPYDAVHEIIRTRISDSESTSNVEGWKNVGFKYQHPDAGINDFHNSEYKKNRYPTAFKLIEEFGDDCPIANYSHLLPQTVLHRHVGPENQSGEFIRIHIPLIVPEGDIFLEVNGKEVNWSDIFAFDNQLAHSAHNLSNKHRLIFLIDIRRSRIGMPPGQKFNKDRFLYSLLKPFVRKNQ
jgi:hypothetical protein